MEHVDRVTKKMKSRLKALRAVSNKEWGTRNEDIRTLYIGYIRSTADYAAAGYQAALSKTQLQKLEVEQNKAARLITGCNRSTPSDPLLHEANLLPFNASRNAKAAIALERFTRNSSNPNQELANKQVASKNAKDRDKRQWRARACFTSKEAGLLDIPKEEILHMPSCKPWETQPSVKFKGSLIEPCRKTDGVGRLNELTRSTLNKLGIDTADVTIWTDGSVGEGQTKGGSGDSSSKMTSI